MNPRVDGRNPYNLRPCKIEMDYIKYREGSVYIAFGETRVICTASIEERVPPFLRGTGSGWITAEYAMLPGSTGTRTARETGRGGTSGRTHEIQRLIGRSLRAAVDLTMLGERSIMVDCDVIQADGGTRTTSINGAFMCLLTAVEKLMRKGSLKQNPIRDFVSAVSVGIVDGVALLDLCYQEDSRADVDMNVVGMGDGRLIEVQGTAEKNPYTETQLFEMLEVARMGLDEIRDLQQQTIVGRVDLEKLFPSLEWLKG